MRENIISPARREESICVIAPIVLTRTEGRYRVNDRYGRLFDELAASFSEVYVLGGMAEETDTTFFPTGKPLYTYEINSPNVLIVPMQISTSDMNPIKKLRVLSARIPKLVGAVRSVEKAYIVMPGFTSVMAVIISKLFRKPYILYFGSDWETMAPFMARWEDRTILLKIYQYISQIAERFTVQGSLFTLVTGKLLQKRLQKYGDHVIETVPMIPLRQSDFFGREDTCPCGSISLLFIGALTPLKGPMELIQAVPLIRSKGLDVECTFIGGGDLEYRNTLVQASREMGCEEHIQFQGYINNYSDILDAYRSADIFILPTHSEGFPRVIYEAMSQSLPVVTTDIPSISAMLVDSKHALLVSPGQSEEIASAVLKIVRDPALRMRLIEEGNEFVRERISGNTTGSQILCILSEMEKRPEGKTDLTKWSRRYYSQSKSYQDRMLSKWSNPWMGIFTEYVKTVNNYAPKKGRILDLGCGGGQSSYLLSKVSESVVGVDFSFGMLSGYPAEKKSSNLFFVNGDAVRLPFKRETFDVVGSYATLEHLEEIDRVLSTCGSIIFMGPNMLSPFHSLKLFWRGIVTGEKHPDGRILAVFKRFWSLIKKSISSGYQFEYRDPYISDLELPGSDFDAICLINPIDLRKWAKLHGYRVLSVATGSSLGGRIISRVLPDFAGGLCFIALKDGG